MTEIIDEQPTLFNPSRWPRKPYCTDALEDGLRIRPLKTALTRLYLQQNPPHLRAWLVFDVDREHAAYSWYDANLPAPTWVAVNPQNGHAHIAYGLSVPVLMDADTARTAPMRYLAAIENTYRVALRADLGYSGLITKNPRHWPGIPEARGRLYDLDELADYVDLATPKAKLTPSEAYGLGRNCTIFEYLRHRAYRLVRDAKQTHGDHDRWLLHLNGLALTKNTEFIAPLDGREIWHIAKSVGKWTWHKFDIKAPHEDAKWRAKQAHRGRKGGMAKGAAYADKRAQACLMRAQGVSQRGIAAALGVDKMTVNRWLKS